LNSRGDGMTGGTRDGLTIWLALGLTVALIALGCGDSRLQAARSEERAARGLTNPGIHSFAITLDKSAMSELARAPKDWVRGSLKVDGGETHREVAIHIKGQRSLRTWAGKPAFKLAFDKYGHADRRVLGLGAIALNNMVDDASMLREQVASRVFSAVGVPAPSAAYAEVSINGELFGLYSVLEAVDDHMLARHFGGGDGALYEGEYGCDLYEDDVWGFEHDGGKDPERKHLHQLASAVSAPVESWFGPGSVLDRDRVLGYLAASTLLADFDGYRHGHNYRVYRDPTSSRWSFIPWGFDRVLQSDFGVFDSHGRVAQRCFAEAGCRLAYVQKLRAAIDVFEQLSLPAWIDRVQEEVTPLADRDPRRSFTKPERARAVAKLTQFIKDRPAHLRRQLGCWDGSQEIDADGDGYGCMDCNDRDAAIHPGAVDSCGDKVDNDCSGQVDDAPSCSCPIHEINGKRYALCNVPMSYWDAEQFCHAQGYTLASVPDKAALTALAGAAQRVRKDEWWVGLSDQGHEGTYLWPDASRPARGLWARGEPDHYVCGQNCAAIRPGRHAALRDLHCATTAPFACSVGE
ncbi:MAG: CotH kinase family protein, partial [Polyangiales bacterium]